MALFGFADKYALFDVTPVENLFIQEYMLRADGDFVKVYLYGLMQCYHPSTESSLATIARDLGMEERRVENAFGYWERMGLLRRVSDNPPAYAYENLKQLELMRAQDDDGSYKYADFVTGLQALFGSERLLHPQDFELVYQWIEDLGLPEEVVLLLVSWQIQVKNSKKFKFKTIDHIAREWAEAGVKSDIDAEALMRNSSERVAAIKQVYKKLGKRHNVSEPDEDLFAKWTERWGFDLQTILAAADETTKGTPTFAYLDGILERMHSEGIRDAKGLRASQVRDQAVKNLLKQLGMRGTGPTEDSRSMLEGFLADGFEEETIALAAVRVSRKGGKLDALSKTLEMWKAEGALTLQAAEDYLRQVDAGRGQSQTQSTPRQKPAKTVLAQQYSQREYTREELNALFEDI